MLENLKTRFTARFNAFKIGSASYWPRKNTVTTADLLARTATAGLTAAGLNYPDHIHIFDADTGARL